MKVEVLFPEVCALFGDHGNILFLEHVFGKENVIKTSFMETPKFLNESIDLIYMGAMSERTQVKVIDKLMPHYDVLRTKIEAGMKVLFTGNAFDILGKHIIDEGLNVIEALGIFEYETKIKRNPRFNDVVLGKDSSGLEIVGHKTQFTQSFGDNAQNYFIQTEVGTGMHKDSQFEGLMYKGLIATNLTGPLLPLNPDFAQKFLKVDIVDYDILMAAKLKKINDIRTYYSK